LQAWHAAFLLALTGPLPPPAYVAALYLAPTAFYLFFRGVLLPRERVGNASLLWLLPVAAAPWVAPRFALPLAFALGGTFAILLTRLALRLREQRRRYRLEAAAFGAHAGLALLALGLGVAIPWVGLRGFVLGYASLIGVGLLAALYTLLRVPDLAANAVEAVRTAYANSTLRAVDVEAALARLTHAMNVDRLYTQESLSLASLAEAIQLGPHQLSELINTRFGVGFPRYVREQRVRAAQQMLLEEPRASVLSVGMAVGFASQSNFYAAFREITGEVPGRFRRRERVAGQTGHAGP
jgi:AraC-like DNA-binding protein